MNQSVALDRTSRVLMLAPHPDDESLAAGGLLQRAQKNGSAVRVLFATDGDNNPWAQRAVEHIWKIGPGARIRWAQRRRGESLAALARLGVAADQAVYLGHPDQGLTALMLDDPRSLVDELVQQCSAWRPTLVIAPSMNDLHPDHSAWGVAARLAWRRLDGGCTPFTLIAYLVHGHALKAGESRIAWMLSDEELANKRSAIMCHRTQLRYGSNRLLRHARAIEVYERVNQRDSSAPLYAHRAAFERGNLILEQSGSATRQAVRVHVLAASEDDDLRTFSVVVSHRSKGAVRQAKGGHTIARANVQRLGRSLRLEIPETILGRPSLVLTKWVNKQWFFDESGWQLRHNASPATSDGSSPSPRAQRRMCAVIPCFNVGTYCEEVVRQTASMVDDVIVVDDGSTDATADVLRRIAREDPRRLHLLSYPVNQGKGAALLEAFRYALASVPFDVLVTLDGDGQHSPIAITHVARPCIEDACDLVVGERLELAKMPLRSRVGNALIRRLVRTAHRSAPMDTQSGFRAHSRVFVRDVVRNVRGQRYETEMQILLLALRQRRHIRTVTIPTIYRDGNKSSHYRPILDSMRITLAFIAGTLTLPASAESWDELRSTRGIIADARWISWPQNQAAALQDRDGERRADSPAARAAACASDPCIQSK